MFSVYGWLPNDVHWAARVLLDAPRLAVAFATLEASPVVSTTTGTITARMKVDLPSLLRLFHEIGLDANEALYFRVGSDIGVWAVPTSCEATEHTRFASGLGVAIRPVDGVSSAAVAVDGPSGRGLLQFSSGQMWITDASRTPELLCWLANVPGTHPDREGVTGMLGLQLRDGPREATMQLWSNSSSDPYTLFETRVDSDGQLINGTVRYYVPTVISPK